MDPRDAEIIKKHLVTLTDQLDPSNVYAALIQHGIITFDEKESIQVKPTRRDRALELIEVVLRKGGPDAFWVFKEALKRDYPHLHYLLSKKDGTVEG